MKTRKTVIKMKITKTVIKVKITKTESDEKDFLSFEVILKNAMADGHKSDSSTKAVNEMETQKSVSDEKDYLTFEEILQRAKEDGGGDYEYVSPLSGDDDQNEKPASKKSEPKSKLKKIKPIDARSLHNNE